MNAESSRGARQRVITNSGYVLQLDSQGNLVLPKVGDSIRRIASKIIDPFAGIGGCAYQALLHGCHFTGVELEEKFAVLANENIQMWNERYAGKLPRFGTARVLQGDSRHLAELVGAANCAVSSPPYAGVFSSGVSGIDWSKTRRENGKLRDMTKEPGIVNRLGAGIEMRYSETPNNLGNLPEGDFQAAISSPPYSEARIGESSGAANVGRNENYGNGNGQLGNMQGGDFSAAISSPPYAGSVMGATDYVERMERLLEQPFESLAPRWQREVKKYIRTHQATSHHQMTDATYGETDGQLGAMAEGNYNAAVSSPPYEASARGTSRHGDSPQFVKLKNWTGQTNFRYSDTDTADQLGNQSGETFWLASRTILEQVHSVLAPRGVAVFVCKDFVRAKKRVPFCDQWRALCEAVGFEHLFTARAWLTETHGTQSAMDGNHKNLGVSRKSFFRRLCESKGGPAIDYEQIIFMKKH